MKKLVFFASALIIGCIFYYSYNQYCEQSPECACKSSLPGDPTCMSKEQLDLWCKQQAPSPNLPQCHLD